MTELNKLRDFTNSVAKFPFIGVLGKKCEGARAEGGLNKLNQGKIIEIS